MMKKINIISQLTIITLFFMLLYSCDSLQIVSGTVYDSITKQAIDSVFVQKKDSETSIYTDENGYFKIEDVGLSPTTVVISKAGYDTVIIEIENKENKIIYLKRKQEQYIIGKWELDYIELIYGGMDAPNERSTIELFENGNYIRFIWGFESGGTFQVTENELWLDEKYKIGDREGSERGEYLLNIEKLEEDSLIISFIECDTIVFQTYLRID